MKYLQEKGETEIFIKAILRIARINKVDINITELRNLTSNSHRVNFDTINESVNDDDSHSTAEEEEH